MHLENMESKICDIIDIINHTLNEQLYPASLVLPGDVKMVEKKEGIP